MAKRKRTGTKVFPKRASLWIPFDVTNTMTTAGGAVASNDLLANYFSQTGAEVPIGATVGPVRWTAGMHANSATASIDRTYSVEMLMQLEKEGGRVTLPVPGVDIVDAPWYGQMFYTGYLIEQAAGVFQSYGIEKEFVTNAMRKITGNGQILRIFATANSNTDMNVRHIGHVFLKLP